MILVDVQALQLGEVYDFELEEEKTVNELISDIVTLICKKENKSRKEDTDYFLYAMSRECILSGELTLREQRIRDGERLVLV